MSFTYATVCSGVEGCSLALEAAPPTKGEWEPVFFSEIAKFPAAVLAHHWPEVPNLGDLAQIRFDPAKKEITNGSRAIPLRRRLDLLAGGTPCQDFSVAGKRGGGYTRKRNPKQLAGSGCDWLPNWVRALSFGKTCRGAFPLITGETSPSSWPRLLSSGMAAHGEFWTRSIPEWTNGPWQSRNDAGVCGLSAWLMPTSQVPPKYFLSRKACLGILARSERRGRPLPPALEEALRRQAAALATTTN